MFTKSINKQIYKDFLLIDSKSYQEQIRYYEMNRREILRLPEEYQILIECRYAIALYEVEDYYGFLTKAERLIRQVIMENVFTIDGKDIYQELLYRKGMATHRLLDYYKANHIFTELVKIDTKNKLFSDGYTRNEINKSRYEIKYLNAISILLFFVSATIIGLEVLMIRTFYPEFTQLFEWSRNGIFLCGVFIIIFLEFWIRLKTYRSLKKLKHKSA